jgi:hypothetical protein
MKLSLTIPVRFVVCAAVAASTLMAPASAAKPPALCSSIQSVKDSAVLSANAGKGGHVKQHVLGETAGATFPQTDKTLFADSAKYAAAWRQFVLYGTVACSGSNKGELLTLAQLHMSHLDAYKCEASHTDGSCSAKTLYVATSVRFYFILHNSDWILQTAYPEPLT